MSVFTFDPDPPRVSSPWLRPADSLKKSATDLASKPTRLSLQAGLLSDYGVTKLEAEPQDGPTEYKLHLLLRPRRNYLSMNTTARVSSSTKTKPPPELRPQKVVPGQTRQARLEHLTTQLLWRLQQSCPYHAASTTTELVIPQLPDASITINEPVKIGKLLPGLEVSRGALYEIGVADDGTLVGLTKDEMDESLATLRVMAASLGCSVEILRMVIVGDCEWSEDGDGSEPHSRSMSPTIHRKKLWVSEALVSPELGSRDAALEFDAPKSRPLSRIAEALPDPKQEPLTTNQLRMTLTGPTTSGKSTLLGTLSTGTLDNGHGKSRLSLLKHRHEVASGITSSVAQELIGYNSNSIYNYSHGGIESWIDIHDFTKDGRLVFVLDSAGHPRYRRTILRGIIGWAPDWTLLCISADETEASLGPGVTLSAQDLPGTAGSGVDLAKAHLDLCLNLDVPLAVVITKFDLVTSRLSLQRTLGKILSSVKAAGRIPRILPADQTGTEHLTEVPAKDVDTLRNVIDEIRSGNNLQHVVPIILTSAVKGTGIGQLHALLQSIPLPPTPTPRDYIGHALNPEQPACLFHIEDRFSLPASYASVTQNGDQRSDMGTVVAGYLRFGELSVGDKVLVGPFPSEEDDLRGATPENRPSPGNHTLSISHPSSVELARIAARNAVSASTIKGEWHNAHIVSIRNLRLPVQSLQAGQVGSIGIIFDVLEEGPPDAFFESDPPSIPKLRKGMVLAIPSKHMVDTGLSLQAASGLTASFPDPQVGSLVVGVLVNIYVASVRAAARISRVTQARPQDYASRTATEDIDDVFRLNDNMDADELEPNGTARSGVEVQLELLTNREWIELGSRILVLEGGSKDKSGLEGLVGQVIEIVD